MKEIKIAVIMFPGTNCEVEAKAAVDSVGMKGDILRWNSSEDLTKYHGFILPGGWSYEDRIRAGVISAKDPVMDIIREQAGLGKPVIGICNGAQILVESKLIPGLTDELQMALARNKYGYRCIWTNVKNNTEPGRCAFNIDIDKGHIMRIPIAHGEGRFTSKDEKLLAQLGDNDQFVFKYCDEYGVEKNEYPINPNGAVFNTAGVCNKEGNVMSLMPHPERANFMYQMPGFSKSGKLAQDAGPGRVVFVSMKKYIEQNLK